MKTIILSLALVLMAVSPLPAKALGENEIETAVLPVKDSLRHLLTNNWKIQHVSSNGNIQIIYLNKSKRTQNIICYLNHQLVGKNPSTSLCFSLN